MRHIGRLFLLLFLGACQGAAHDGDAPRSSGRDGDSVPSTGDGTEPIGSGPPGLDHVLVTGQSNSIGFASSPALTQSQPLRNVMFDVGVMTARACDPDGCREYAKPTKLVPLVEGDTYFDYPVETVASGFANEASKLTGGGRPLLVSIHGRSGNGYECLRKGGCMFHSGKGYVGAFAEALRQVEDAKQLARAAGLGPVAVRAVAVIHGESDHYAPPFPLDGTDGRSGAVQTYAEALVEWQRDYESSVRSVTNQTSAVPLLVSQMSNWNDRPDSEIPSRQLEAHVRAPGKVVLVGPTYMLPFATDCIHFTSHGERQLGEYFGKVYGRVQGGNKWEPLRPLEAKRTRDANGEVVNVRFAVPAPPLVLDTEHVTDPGDFGFEYVDGTSSARISEVSVRGPDTVTIRLDGASTGGSPRLRYAMRATPYTCPGPTQGPRGNLRDSDATPSLYGYDLFNWAVHFDLPVE